MTADNGLQRAVLLWNSREVTDIPPEFVLMEHPLILARRPDRDIELLDAARTVGVRQTCGGGSGVGRAVVVSPVAEIEELGDDADGADGDPRFQERQGLPRPDI
jgi:hypothetical protein